MNELQHPLTLNSMAGAIARLRASEIGAETPVVIPVELPLADHRLLR